MMQDKIKRQNDLWLIAYIGKYGCFFMCLVYYYSLWLKMPELDHYELNDIWETAINTGVISGDLNHDGDLDDAGECLVRDKEELLRIAGINAKYELADAKYISKLGDYLIAEMFNKKTNFTHFVVIDGKRNVIYDPIKDSITARDGIIKTIRVLRKV